jgi:hypothetical protein
VIAPSADLVAWSQLGGAYRVGFANSIFPANERFDNVG